MTPLSGDEGRGTVASRAVRGALMGAALSPSIPLAIMYNLFIDRFVEGFTMASLKT